ncbi:hypothetical protein QBC43DRAFT_68883 [Cladorrhinum sp. PSN259]|nr:hypothetical protein QBC43DRAFT_68883 [Cladorrhinum sp. PSN259]
MPHPGRSFSLRHIPALILASSCTIGGLWANWNAEAAMTEFGFPPHIAQAPQAVPVMMNGQARTTVLGILTFVFYFRGNYREVDTLMTVFGFYAGLVDSYIVWKANPANLRWAFFRLAASWVFGVCGSVGLTGSGIV